ncbi:hypothetical protein WN51_12025 [Melipona quadrifasciata]|uniref:Uncharacterized protein n=1 Tax=Melipona quadrifasciata TaxID=166423 RepID=A0A0N0BH88_9HYME|nr:hypothetical protein WN51_12025 [Melipona quadrifasciata]
MCNAAPQISDYRVETFGPPCREAFRAIFPSFYQ